MTKDDLSSPTVSVVLTVYNGESYVDDAVESILSQSFSDFEFIIIDDGSNDGTVVVINQFEDERIRLFQQENQGRANSLNKGLRAAKGEYVAIIDDDDIAHSKRLESQVEFLDSHPDVSAVGSWFKVVDPTNQAEGKVMTPPVDSNQIMKILPQTNPLAHSTMLYRKADVLAVGGYDDDLDSCIDYDLWVRLATAGYRLKNIDEVLCTLRKSDDLSSFSFTGFKMIIYYQTMFAIRWRAAKGLDIPDRYLLYPFLMLLWALVPDSMNTIAKRIISHG